MITKYKRPRLIHSITSCTNCKWTEENYLIGVTKAREHAKKTGHEVVVEIGYFQIYNPKE